MNKEQIIQIIKDEVICLKWDYEKCLEALAKINFEIDKVVGNELFDETKVKTTVAMAYYACA
ncbi:hypothetical protein bcgnr5369_02650 [Bacillus cereus]